MENEVEVKEEKSLTRELLADQRDDAERWFKAFCISLKINLVEVLVMFALVITFIWYLYQYDFTSSIEQTGVYALVDSSGNVISSDITAEQIERILEILNDGESKGNEKQD